MTREVFLERLSYMEGYHAVPDEFYDVLKYKKKRSRNYSVGTDSRFASRYLDYASPKDKGHDAFLTYVAFSIAASLSITCMQQPSQAELKEMLGIMGYSPEQMEQYARQRNGIEPDDVPVPRLQAAVFLLSHALDDAMADRSEWRRRKRYEENPALKKLQKLSEYMQENGLLEFSDRIYEDKDE